MDYKYTGIILSKINVGETDRIYTIYTKEAGKVRFLGKGVRKPNAKLAGSLEPLTLSEIFVAKSQGMGKITGAIVLENFSRIKTDVDILNKINYVLKIFGKIIAEQEQDKNVFEILEGFLKSLNKLAGGKGNENKTDILVLGFLFKLLSEMGYQLEVEKCVQCQENLKPENNYFSAARGGILCQNCRAAEEKQIHSHTKNIEFSNTGYFSSSASKEYSGVGVKISSESIKLIRIILKNKIENLIKLQVGQKDINNLKIIMQETVSWL